MTINSAGILILGINYPLMADLMSTELLTPILIGIFGDSYQSALITIALSVITGSALLTFRMTLQRGNPKYWQKIRFFERVVFSIPLGVSVLLISASFAILYYVI